MPSDGALLPYRNLATKKFPPFFSVNAPQEAIKGAKILEPDVTKTSSSDLILFFNTLKTDESKLLDDPPSKTVSPHLNNNRASPLPKLMKPPEKAKNFSEVAEKSHKFYSFVVVFLMVQKFFIKLQNSRLFRRQKLNFTIFKFIQDKGFFPEGLLKTHRSASDIKATIWETIEFILGKVPIFQIDNRAVLTLDFFEIFMIFGYLIVWPLDFGVSTGQNIQYFRKSTCLMFLFQNIVMLNVAGIGKNGEVLLERTTAIKVHIKQSSFFESVIILFIVFMDAFELLCLYPGVRLILLMIFSILAMRELALKTEKLLVYSSFTSKTINFCEFLLLGIGFLFFLHVFSGIWLFCGYSLHESTTKTWMESANLLHQPIGQQYLAAFHQILLITTTVGPSDILHHQTWQEQLSIIALILCGLVILAFNSSKIFEITSTLGSKKQKNLWKILETLNELRFGFGTKLLVFNYLKQNENQNGFYFKEVQENLPAQIQKEILFKRKLDLLEKNVFFSNFSKSFRETLASKFLVESHPTGAILIQAFDSFSNPKLFLIEHGEVELFLERSILTLQNLGIGCLFGLTSFISATPSEYSARTLVPSRILTIGRVEFLQILSHYPRDFETFCCLRDSVVLNSLNLEASCAVCQSQTHTLMHCPALHLVVNRTEVITREGLSFNQKRESHLRRMKRGQNARFHLLKVRDAVARVFSDSSSVFDVFSNSVESSKRSSKPAMDEDQVLLRLKMDNSTVMTDQSDKRLEAITNSFFLDSGNQYFSTTNNFENSISSFDRKGKFTDQSETSLGRLLKKKGGIKKMKSYSLINLNSFQAESQRKQMVLSKPKASENLTSILEDEEELESDQQTSVVIRGNRNPQNKNQDIECQFAMIYESELEFDRLQEYDSYFKHNNASLVQKQAGGKILWKNSIFS